MQGYLGDVLNIIRQNPGIRPQRILEEMNRLHPNVGRDGFPRRTINFHLQRLRNLGHVQVRDSLRDARARRYYAEETP